MILEKVPYYVYAGLKERTQREIAYPITKLTLDFIAERVCKFFKVEVSDVQSLSRKREFVIPRQLIGYLAYQTGNYTLKSIANFLNRDHSSIIYGNQFVRDYMSVDLNYKTLVERVESSLFDLEEVELALEY